MLCVVLFREFEMVELGAKRQRDEELAPVLAQPDVAVAVG
jgi:hypothetical protein